MMSSTNSTAAARVITPPPTIASATLLSQLAKLHAGGGPTTDSAGSFDLWLADVAQGLRVGTVAREELDEAIHALGIEYLQGTLTGRIFSRPYGYSGDFETIDALYRTHVSETQAFASWDLCVQRQPAAIAVRNRKRYFKCVVRRAARRRGGHIFRVLDLGSGPCRDVLECIEENPALDLRFTCVDHDPAAIAYARRLCHRHLDRIEFVNQNVLEFRSDARFDLAWCAGVLDYLRDASAVHLLRVAIGATETGGEVVVGNFSLDNPSRPLMEVMTRWYLRHCRFPPP